jgi:hypothetical protein
MEAKTKEALSQAKDLAAQQNGFSDWYQIDCINESQDSVIEIRYNMIDEVAICYADQQTASLQTQLSDITGQFKTLQFISDSNLRKVAELTEVLKEIATNQMAHPDYLRRLAKDAITEPEFTDEPISAQLHPKSTRELMDGLAEANAECERLRKALRDITECHGNSPLTLINIKDTARNALNNK